MGRITDFPDNRAAPSLLHARLLSRVHTEVCITLPSQQQRDFEIPPHVLGMGGLLEAASIIFIFGRPDSEYLSTDPELL